MLFVLSLMGYPIDGLTQSTVLAVNEVVKANNYVLVGYSAVGLAVVLLVWTCAACCRLMSLTSREHDQFSGPGSQHRMSMNRAMRVAVVNSGEL